jgi:RNA polymerase-binding protein DksA
METMAEPKTSDLTRLESERQETIEKMEHLRIEMHALAEPSADEADVDAYEREKTWALIQSLQRKLVSLDHAIESARQGTYGICETCGNPIDPARLEILPQASLCLECQREVERSSKRRYR